jgi:hypothetical protein
MGTRSGDVDPSLHLFLHQEEQLTLEQITDILTRKSGLLGVSGVSHDMRSVIAAATRGKLAGVTLNRIVLLSLGASTSGLDGRTLFHRCTHLYRRHRRKQPVDPGTGAHASRNPEPGDRFKAE